MKFILIILSVSISFSQQKKIKFDANKLNDPKPNWPKISSPFSSDVLNYNQTIDQDSIIIEGYRVQVLATRERFKAEKLQSDLEELFEYNIYVIFEAPNYKVRIGDFIDRQKAEKFRKKLSGNGYSSAWIIRTKIDSINN